MSPDLIATAQRLHHARYAVGASGRDQQVDVVGHQNIGVERAIVRQQRIGEHRQEEPPVGVLEENHLPVVTALDDMVRVAFKDEAGLAGQRRAFRECFCKTGRPALAGQLITLTPFLRR